jgi:chitodextrinase
MQEDKNINVKKHGHYSARIGEGKQPQKLSPRKRNFIIGGIVSIVAIVGIIAVFVSKAATIVPITPYSSFFLGLGVNNVSTTVLDGEKNPRKIYDIDMENTPASTISALKSKGIIVECYFSAGSAENYRSDYSKFLPADMGNTLSGWPDEKWVDTRSLNVRSIMKARMDTALSKGCNGIDPDNVDGYQNNTGFPLTQATQLDYLNFLATEAHARNLNIGLKNSVGLITASTPSGAKIVDLFDWAINEECYTYNECGNYSQFIAKNKGVFIVEYAGTDANFIANICPKANASNYDAYLMNLALNGTKRVACRTGADIVTTNIAPTVSLTSPVNNSTFTAPANVTLTANATDSDGKIAKVEFYSGGKLLGTSTTAPYTYAYNSLPAASYTVNAVAYDDKGASSTSAPINFTVSNPVTADTQAPVGPTNLAAKANTSSSVGLTWTSATDNVGVAQYLVFRNGTQVGSSTTTSYTDNNLTASTAYSYQVKAKDAAGNTSTGSNTVSVTTPAASIADTTPPSVPGNFKVTLGLDSNSSSYYTNLAWTASTDNIGVKDYLIKKNNTLIGTTPNANFKDYSISAGTYYTYEVSARDTANNVSSSAKSTVIINCFLIWCSI